MITLTKQQDEAIQLVKQKIKDGQKIVTIAGYAGTGKTTLVNYIIESFGYSLEDVAFAAFTGKASLVLQKKGIPAKTLHALLYTSFRNTDGSFSHIPKKELDENYRLIVIDEISMTPMELLRVAMTHDIPIIALGDIGQLPPIGEDNGLLRSPDVILTEILRQEKDNPIIQLSLDIREGKQIKPQKNDNIVIVEKKDLVSGMLTWADQVICGYNETRATLNQSIRASLGFNDVLPVEGEKIICLKNYWDTCSKETRSPLINGATGKITSTSLKTKENIRIDFEPDYDSDVFKNIIMDLNPFMGKPHEFKPIKKYGRKQAVQPKYFDWGYAITTHKSQGSQYQKVLVYEEVLNRSNHKRWLYTAVTRAEDKLILVID